MLLLLFILNCGEKKRKINQQIMVKPNQPAVKKEIYTKSNTVTTKPKLELINNAILMDNLIKYFGENFHLNMREEAQKRNLSKMNSFGPYVDQNNNSIFYMILETDSSSTTSGSLYMMLKPYKEKFNMKISPNINVKGKEKREELKFMVKAPFIKALAESNIEQSLKDIFKNNNIELTITEHMFLENLAKNNDGSFVETSGNNAYIFLTNIKQMPKAQLEKITKELRETFGDYVFLTKRILMKNNKTFNNLAIIYFVPAIKEEK